MKNAENSSFKRKRQENILTKKKSIEVILLVEIYTIYVLISQSLLWVRNKQKPLTKSNRPRRLFWLAEGIVQKLLFLVRVVKIMKSYKQ